MEGIETIIAGELKHYLDFLASDEFLGSDSPSRELSHCKESLFSLHIKPDVNSRYQLIRFFNSYLQNRFREEDVKNRV